MTRTLYEFGRYAGHMLPQLECPVVGRSAMTVYRNRNEMIKAITDEWITGGGNKTDLADEVAGVLCAHDDHTLSHLCAHTFELDRLETDNESHMTFNDYNHDDLMIAFREMRQ